jgi:hypothetical protein
MSFVSPHLSRYRRRLGVVYGAVALENGLDLLYPFATGLAVDDLLAGRTRGVWVFAVIWAVHAVVGLARQRYAASVFAGLYAELATDVVMDGRRRGVDVSATVARSALAFEFVDFCERNVNDAITAAFGIVGSLVLITLYDRVLGAAALALTVPFALLTRWMSRRSTLAIATLNDEYELEAEVVANGSADDVAHHYRAMGRDQVRLVDAQTRAWGSVEAFVIALAVFAFVRATDVSDQPGTIYAIVAYVWAYVASFDDLPTVMLRLTGLRDIVRRLDASD